VRPFNDRNPKIPLVLVIAVAVTAACGSAGSPQPTSVFLADATPGPMAIETEPSQDSSAPCLGTQVDGLLVPAPQVGFVLFVNGQGHAVIWPFGYSGLWQSDGAVLLDRSGTVVAHEADRISLLGSIASSGVVHPCYDPYIRITVPAPQLPPLPTAT
jgi:hypothetical protein